MVTKQHRQEAICKAYVRAVAAQAGVICSRPELDYGVDLCLRAVRRRSKRLADVSAQLDLQLKSTTRAQVTDSQVLFDLELKTYDDLIPRRNLFTAQAIHGIMEWLRERRNQ